jgi:hypothetical protein
MINKGPMQDSFRNSRNSAGNVSLDFIFIHPRYHDLAGGGAGNILANARRQYQRYVALAQAAGRGCGGSAELLPTC